MRDDPVVRTTLDIADDVLQAAKEIASRCFRVDLRAPPGQP
jgi:hypothetical protein